MQVGGGESGYIAPYPPDPNIVFANAEAFASRYDKRTGQSVDISVWPLDVSGNGAEKLLHRFNWTSPLMISPHDPNIALYSHGDGLQIHRPGAKLDRDQRRPHAAMTSPSRSLPAGRSRWTLPALSTTTRFSPWPNRR